MSASSTLSRGITACLLAGATMAFSGAARIQTEDEKMAAFVKDRLTQSLDGEGRVFYDGERRVLTSYDCTLNPDARVPVPASDLGKNLPALYGCGHTTVDFKNDLVAVYNLAQEVTIQHPVSEIYHMSGLATDLKTARDALCLSIVLPKIPERKLNGVKDPNHKHH